MRTLGGRYRLVDQIGAGGMARVWLAHDEVLDRPVAVKLQTDEHGADAEELRRAQTEARSAGRLAHPNVAAVYDFGTSRRGLRGMAYVVMELVEGPLLNEYLRGGPLPWRFAVRVAAEVSAGLAAAHSQGIVHRDIKPSNIVLTHTGAKILDFGIAARIGGPDQLPDGSVLGSAAYMAPERLTGSPVAPALDMYAWGVLLYRSLTARLPWDAHNNDDLWHAHLHQPAAALPAIADLAPEVGLMCAASLDKDPTRRPTAAAAALILAASVGAQVYLPTLLDRPTPPAGQSPSVPAAPAADHDRVDAVTERRPGLRR